MIERLTFADLPEIIDTSLAAAYLGLTRETVQNYAREGRIRAARFGKVYRFRREWLLDFLEDEADKNTQR